MGTLYDHAVFSEKTDKKFGHKSSSIQHTYSKHSLILTVSSFNYLCTIIHMKMFLSHVETFVFGAVYSSQHLYRYNEVNELAKFTVKNMGEVEKGEKGGTTV